MSNVFEGSDGGSMPVEQLARALVDKLDAIHNDPQYKAVWLLHQLHAGMYTGPNYADELKALRDRLNRLN